jgi:hypothetical protein
MRGNVPRLGARRRTHSKSWRYAAGNLNHISSTDHRTSLSDRTVRDMCWSWSIGMGTALTPTGPVQRCTHSREAQLMHRLRATGDRAAIFLLVPYAQDAPRQRLVRSARSVFCGYLVTSRVFSKSCNMAVRLAGSCTERPARTVS